MNLQIKYYELLDFPKHMFALLCNNNLLYLFQSQGENNLNQNIFKVAYMQESGDLVAFLCDSCCYTYKP